VNFFTDLFSILGICLGLFVALDRQGFILSVVVGIVLGGGCWAACSYFSRLWNLRFRTSFIHHILCFVAALLTIAFSILFASLKYTKEAAYASVMAWEVQINSDPVWANATFAIAFDAVRKLGVEDFSNVPLPGMPNSHIPTNNNRSILAAASTYAVSGSKHFDKNRPFLSKIIKGKSEVPQQLLDADIKNFFATIGNSYPPPRAISLVASETKRELDTQVPRVVTYARIVLVLIFLLAQAVPFGLVGYAAYKDLRVNT